MLPKLTDREIEEACRLLSAYEVATIPPEDTYTDIRSADYTAYMDDLISKSYGYTQCRLYRLYG